MFLKDDKVMDCVLGSGVVTDVRKDSIYNINVDLDSGVTEYYTSEGKRLDPDIYPRLFHLEGYTAPSAPEPKRLPDLAIDTKMIVGLTWHRHFSHWGKNGDCVCFNDGKTSFTSEDTSSWGDWDLYES